MEFAPRLKGTHELRRQVQEGLRSIGTEKESDGCCHGDHDHNDVEDAFEMDPGLAQCCLQEIEDRKKRDVIMSALEKSDPVRKHVEERSRRGMSQTYHETAAEWAQRISTVNNIQSEKCCGDSDDELDAFLEDFEDLQTCDQGKSSVVLGNLSDENELATFLSQPNHEICSKVVVFTSEKAIELSNACTQTLTRLVTAEESQNKAILAWVDISAVGANHPVFRAQWFVQEEFILEAPFVVFFEPSSLAPLNAFSREELEKSSHGGVRAWWLRYLEDTSGEEVKDTGNDKEKPASSYCGRPDCGRSFPHEHVQRFKKDVEET